MVHLASAPNYCTAIYVLYSAKFSRSTIFTDEPSTTNFGVNMHVYVTDNVWCCLRAPFSCIHLSSIFGMACKCRWEAPKPQTVPARDAPSYVISSVKTKTSFLDILSHDNYAPLPQCWTFVCTTAPAPPCLVWQGHTFPHILLSQSLPHFQSGKIRATLCDPQKLFMWNLGKCLSTKIVLPVKNLVLYGRQTDI